VEIRDLNLSSSEAERRRQDLETEKESVINALKGRLQAECRKTKQAENDIASLASQVEGLLSERATELAAIERRFKGELERSARAMAGAP
jgi:hypothetical protein